MGGNSCQESVHSCSICFKSFPKRRNLTLHVRRNHTERRFQCYHCSYACKIKGHLLRHIRKVHLRPSDPNRTIKSKQTEYSCVLCNDYVSNFRNQVIRHYIESHDVKVIEKQLSFASVREFEQWKSGVEQTDVCRFIRYRGSKNQMDRRVQYFRCFRDGTYKPLGKGLRRLKVQGSNKMNGVCPASIIAVEDKLTGTVDVSFTSGHVGHCQDVGRLGLTKDEKAQIARKIAAGVPFQAIIDETRGAVENNELSRIHLTTRRDLNNIRRSFSNSDHSVKKIASSPAQANPQELRDAVGYLVAEGGPFLVDASEERVLDSGEKDGDNEEGVLDNEERDIGYTESDPENEERSVDFGERADGFEEVDVEDTRSQICTNKMKNWLRNRFELILGDVRTGEHFSILLSALLSAGHSIQPSPYLLLKKGGGSKQY